MNPSQLTGIAYRVSNTREEWKSRPIHKCPFCSPKETESLKEKGKDKEDKSKLGKNQCAYCKEEGHRKKNFPKLQK
jgi:hypothetical protein